MKTNSYLKILIEVHQNLTLILYIFKMLCEFYYFSDKNYSKEMRAINIKRASIFHKKKKIK
jgi:hypothetical protein